ncbi:unnamed protein product, partial [Ectocarpus sp. 12 AP-2014]
MTTTSRTSAKKMLNSSGDSTHPCRTPCVTKNQSDTWMLANRVIFDVDPRLTTSSGLKNHPQLIFFSSSRSSHAVHTFWCSGTAESKTRCLADLGQLGHGKKWEPWL